MVLKRRVRKSEGNQQSGFSLIELMLAMVVLAVGLLGGMIVIVTAIATNARNRFDTAAVALAQSTMDRIIVLSAGASGQTTQMTDCNGTVNTLNTSAIVGGGSTLTSFASVINGNQIIDFTQAPVAGYQMFYTLCAAGATDGLPLGNPQVYDVRWNIQTVAGAPNQEMVLVAAKSNGAVGNGNQTRFFAMPITLRALRGN
jgi:prepilin-type N-terminal cleavage/methylation domain-containing protein